MVLICSIHLLTFVDTTFFQRFTRFNLKKFSTYGKVVNRFSELGLLHKKTQFQGSLYSFHIYDQSYNFSGDPPTL